jgi:putative spermidine/putrescine transport system substrate-binding protein
MPTLRVIGRSELVTLPIQKQAQADLGFAIDFQMIDSIEGLQRVITRPDSFDLYHQWHTVDLMWTARCIQPIELARLTHGDEVLQAVRGRSGPSRIIDTVFDRLFVQPSGRLGPAPTGALSMLPLLHGVDSFVYTPALRGLIGEGEESWSWLLDPRLQGHVALVNDPVLGMIEAALAVEAQRGAAFGNIGNLTIDEVDEVAEALIARKRLGHFRGFWNSYEDSVRLTLRGAMLSSMFSPGVAQLRSAGAEVTVSTPAEGCRGWHADLCLSAACDGEQRDMAYEYLNWWMGGWAGASAARQGYYTTFPARVRAHLEPGEWEYWYEGQPAARPLNDPYGRVSIPAGHVREGGSHRDRMSRARVWNTFMDEHSHIVRRWREFLAA